MKRTLSAAAKAKNAHSSTSTRRFKVKGDFGALPLDIPSDWQDSFAPPIVGQHPTRWTGFDDKIISPYARGLTVPEIQIHREEIHGDDAWPGLLSTVTKAAPWVSPCFWFWFS